MSFEVPRGIALDVPRGALAGAVGALVPLDTHIGMFVDRAVHLNS